MTRTPEDEFAEGLENLARLAERFGLDRERDVLKCLILGRTCGPRDMEPVAEMAARCAGVLYTEDHYKLRPDPDFPPAGWTGRKPKIDRGNEDDC